ncbi:MAG: ABC transporter permease [Candidatus Bipolaricaulaceae bacterium]
MKTFLRVARYSLMKALLLGFAVVVAVFITILIVNMGGKLDEIRKQEVLNAVSLRITSNPANQLLPPSEIRRMIEERAQLEYRRLGLDKPFLVRTASYLTNAITLNLGRSENLLSDSMSREVRRIIIERLPSTLVLFGTSSILLFFTAVFLALALSRHYGSWFDRLVVSLAPTSTAPGWFYGIFLILIFAAVLRILPFGGMVDAPPPKEAGAYVLSLLKHLILPVLSWFLGGLAASVYSWRTFFLIYSSEDYVEMAKAKGLSSRAIERRYILRPTLPPIVTNFTLMVIGMWMGAIILESVFNWPGMGSLYLAAVNTNDTPTVVGINVIYGYLLAGSVFLLDFIYAIVDPRVRIGAGEKKGV